MRGPAALAWALSLGLQAALAQPQPAPWESLLAGRQIDALRAALPADITHWPTDRHGYGLLHRAPAVEAADPAAPQFAALLQAWLAAGGSPDVTAGARARTPLHQAAAADCGPCVAALLAAGSDPQRPDRDGRQALHFAGPRTIASLRQAGVPVDVRDPSGWTPLHWAAWIGSAERLRVLLAQGANPALSSTGTHTFPGDPAWGEAATTVAPGARALDLSRRRHDETRWSTGRYAESLAILEAATPREHFWRR